MKIIVLTDFQCVFKICFEFPYCHIYSFTCHTVVSDPLFWYSGPDPIAIEEEPEEVAGERHRLI